MIECRDIAEFIAEAGGHRVQEVSGTGKRAKVHTSTVTVAVAMSGERVTADREIPDSEFSVKFYSGTGKGGQKRNKSMSCCTITHIPTGLTQNANGRSRLDNEFEAKAALTARIHELERSGNLSAVNASRREQIGGGSRGDKIRTLRHQDNRIVDHRTCKSCTISEWEKGALEKLW